VQRTAAQKMMQEVLEKLSPAEAWSNGGWSPTEATSRFGYGSKPWYPKVPKNSWSMDGYFPKNGNRF
jgi:hypothetical protein